ncbi:peroxisomal biogenesis factor 11c, isoform CRA_c, partial [Mus musculus]
AYRLGCRCQGPPGGLCLVVDTEHSPLDSLSTSWSCQGGKGAEMRSSQAPARVSGEAAFLGRGGHMRTSGLSEPRARFAKSQEDTARASYLLACLKVSGRDTCLRSGFGKAGI